MKIAVIGYSGAGKSTLAKRLGEQYHADVLHLDTVQYAPNWVIRPQEETAEIVGDFMDSHEAWVIDGNYRSMLSERRFAEADQIVFLMLGRFYSLFRALSRAKKFKNQTRPDMGNGCIEKFDRDFFWWILRDGRTKQRRAWYRSIREIYPEKSTVLKNQREIDRFLKNL